MAALPYARALSRNSRAPLLCWILPALALLLLLWGALPGFAATGTATTLSLSSNTVAADTAVTLTATVKAGSTSITPGQVVFCDASAAHCTDVHRLGMAQLVAGVATLKLIPGAGVHSYNAVFLGTNIYASSVSLNQSLTVSGMATETTIANVSANSEFSSVSGKGLTPPTGTLSFLDTTNANYVLGTATLGAGQSSFALTASTSCATGQNASAVAVGDFNGDGIPDLATANASANTLTICLAHLDGTFTTLTHTFASNNFSPNYVTVGDFNGDGVQDLIVFESSTVTNDVDNLVLLTGAGDGTFLATATSLTVDSAGGDLFAPVAGDFNGDGNADLAVIKIGYLGGYQVLAFRGNGDGTFQAPSTVFSSQNSGPTSLFAADLNNDGRTDLAFGDLNTSTSLIVELGSSAGTFTQRTQTLASAPGNSITGADFNRDGNLDLALIEGGSIVLLNGNGDGTFTAGSLVTPSATPSFLAVGDFNGDGNADLAAVLSGSSTISLYPGNGDGTFAATPTSATGISAGSLATGDFNGDGYADLAVLPSSGTSVGILLADPTSASTVTGSVVTPVGTGTHQVVASYPGDANHAASLSGSSALTAQQVTTALTLLPAPPASTVGQQVTLTATLSPPAAQGHITNGETVVFTTHNGTRTLGTGTLANGVATFSLSSLPAGVSTLGAGYGGDTNFVNSVSSTDSYTVAALTSTTLAINFAGAPVASVASGAVLTLSATVRAGSTLVTPGQVAFCDASAAHCTGVHRLGVAQLTSAGTATLRLVPTIGSHSYQAVFLGTASNAASSSSLSTLSVTGVYATTTMLQSSGSPGSYTLTATVTGIGSGAPSGVLSFPDTTVGGSLGTASLSALSSSLVFSNPQTPATGGLPNSIDTGDFNQDGIPDLVVTNSNDNTLTILLGTGTGTFAASTVSAPATSPMNGPSFVAVADFNSDGIPDLAVVDTYNSRVLLFLGRGDGTFDTPISQSVGSTPFSLVVDDFNNDGIPDLVVANDYSGSASVLLGTGNGTFTTAATIPTPNNGDTDIVAGDFDNDGNQDLAITNNVSGSVLLFFGAGDGTFPSTSTLTGLGSSFHLVATDLNNDGNLDLAVANSNGAGSVTILLGQGNRSFLTVPTSPATGTSPNWITAADLNGDGIPDLITSNRNASGSVSVLLGNGDGTYQAGVSQSAGSLSNGVVSADFNGDGFADLGVANSGSNNVSILLVTPTTSARASASNLAVTGNPSLAHSVEGSYPGDSTHSASTSMSVALSPLPYAAAPVFSPLSGSFTSAQTVSLSSSTAGATIFYTIDGSTPTSASPVYSAPLAVTASVTIHAVASATSYQTSGVATGAYTVNYPPTITTQPNSETINAGNPVTLSVAATGTTPFSYQWYQVTGAGSVPVSGATNAAYTTPGLTASTSYYVQVNNAASVPATSQTAVVTVNTPATITTQPHSQTINAGNPVALSVAATGTTPFSYQWYQVTGVGSSPIAGATNTTYTTPNLTATTSYYAVVNNASNIPATSQTVTVTVITPPMIVSQTPNPAINSGQTATLSVTVSGSTSSFQWFSVTGQQAGLIQGANSSSYTTGPLTAPAAFQVLVSNAAGTSSANFQVSINPVCSLHVQPTSTALAVLATAQCTDPQGQPLTLTLGWGDSTPPLLYASSSPATLTSSHTYAASSSYTVTLSAKDAANLSSTPVTAQVSPNNSPVCTLSSIQSQPPTVVSGVPMYPVRALATCSDPQSQPLALSITWGDGTAVVVASHGTNTHNYVYPNPATATGIYNVVLTAIDTSGLSGSSAPQSFQVVPTTTTLPAGMSSTLPSNTMTTTQPSTIPAATQVTFLCTSVSAVFPSGQVNTTLPSTYGISCSSPTVPLSTTPTPVNVTITTTGATAALLRPGEPASPLVLCGIAVPFLSFVSLFPLVPGKRRRQVTALSLILVLCLSLSACGGSFQAPPATSTPSALYYITVLETVVNLPAPTGFIQTSLIVPLNVTP